MPSWGAASPSAGAPPSAASAAAVLKLSDILIQCLMLAAASKASKRSLYSKGEVIAEKNLIQPP